MSRRIFRSEKHWILIRTTLDPSLLIWASREQLVLCSSLPQASFRCRWEDKGHRVPYSSLITVLHNVILVVTDCQKTLEIIDTAIKWNTLEEKNEGEWINKWGNSSVMTVTHLMVPDRLKNLCSMSNQGVEVEQITAWSPTLPPAGQRTPPSISGITHMDIRMKYKKDGWSHLLITWGQQEVLNSRLDPLTDSIR